jgi:hypothetical protein
MAYIDVPIDSEPTDLAEEAFDYLQEQVPGWLPSPGNLEAWLIEALAQLAGELRALAVLVPDAIFQWFGQTVLGLAPFEATAAQGVTDWTMIDDSGYTIPAGTLVSITPPGSTDAYAFQTLADAVVPAGQTVVYGVQVQAVEPGADSSGITGDVEVIDALDFVDTVTLEGPTSGGADAETSDAYLDRLSDLLTLLSPRPILPQDFAVLAQRSIAGVGRATAIDLYNPGPPVDTNCPRCVTVVVTDENGNPCSSTVKTEVLTLLQAQREVNFLVFVADPTYTTIDVTFQVKVYPGYDPAEVAGRVITQLQTYLSPASWGQPPYGDTSARSWINDTTVRYLEVAEQINRVDGVNYIVTLTIGPHGGTMGTADVPMTGPAGLAKAGTITGTGVA